MQELEAHSGDRWSSQLEVKDEESFGECLLIVRVFERGNMKYARVVKKGLMKRGLIEGS
jgi:hypothetical protein